MGKHKSRQQVKSIESYRMVFLDFSLKDNNMESKYYTPDITEFYVGFEYEMKERFGDGTVKTKEEYDNANWIKSDVINLQHFAYINRTLTGYNSHEHPSAIRVKYLDREDIESLGFINTKNYSECDVFQKHYKDDSVWYELEYYNADLEHELWIEKYTICGTESNGIIDYNSEYIFKGIIKNKSELKQLLKWIGVQA